ncbi:hypothetical protein DL93DRAFT_2170673 [Clavulina sp. PMI_390]|nr:hypothetical protein DL93DRAFT_2170673 [Clavulina sp. PMI_390]
MVQRPLRTEALEARALELELLTHRLTLSSVHSFFLASKKLQERIERLGRISKPHQVFNLTNLIERRIRPASEHGYDSQQERENFSENSSRGFPTAQGTIERELELVRLEDFRDLPPALSFKLIHSFLPFRSQWYFLLDVSHFLQCLTLPASHSESIHHCLLNACYLGACTSIGGALGSFKPHFLQRTRHFLQQSLEFADRPIHFLWASVILGVFFARERRMAECLASAGATARFAVACGLNLTTNPTRGGDRSYHVGCLLPPPKDKIEADDRTRLAHTIFVLGQALPLLCGYAPAFTYDVDDDGWSLISEWAYPGCPDVKITMTAEEPPYLTFLEAHSPTVQAHGYCGSEEEYLAIEKQIHSKPTSSLLLFDERGLQPLEASSTFQPHVILAHATLYGSGLILHSLRANEDAESKRKMLQCAQGLVEICDNARGNRRLHVGMVNAAHMMNAVRIFARELQRSAVRETAERSIDYCRSIELLLDYLDDMVSSLPAWANAPVALKSTLLAAAASLST